MTAYHIQLTEPAKAHINYLLQKEQGLGFRLSIKKTGCSGYSYVPSIVSLKIENDAEVLNAADFPIFIDTQYADLLQAVNIDLIEEKIMGLQQKKLVFHNPKEAGRCGCGKSFHIEEE